MKDDRKSEMRRHYAELLEVQKRIRSLAASAGLDMNLAPDPTEPASVEQLAEAMNVVRTNMHLMEVALNIWDHQMNGCEIRTRALIMNDIDSDQTDLAKPGSAPGGRTREQIELNIAYDHMQLRRI